MKTYNLTVKTTTPRMMSVTDKEVEDEDSAYDFMPPALIANAATEYEKRIVRIPLSVQYPCLNNVFIQTNVFENCLIMDHPFISWLMKNGIKLKNHYPRQFGQIVDSLLYEPEVLTISDINNVTEQLRPIAYNYGIDMEKCPILTEADFLREEVDN